MNGWATFAACALALGATVTVFTVGPRTRAQAARSLPHEERIEHRFDGEPYSLHRWSIPLNRTRLTVVDMHMGRNLARLVRQGAALAINGGFYGTDRRPEGLVVAEGRSLSPFMERIGGGIVALSAARATQHDAEGELRLPERLDFAIQCRPRLVVDGRNNIARRTAQTAARTALCIRDDGRGLDVYVARRDYSRGRAGPTLHTLAAVLVREGCDEALNLDGGPSTGVAWQARDRIRALHPRRGVRHAVLFHLDP